MNIIQEFKGKPLGHRVGNEDKYIEKTEHGLEWHQKGKGTKYFDPETGDEIGQPVVELLPEGQQYKYKGRFLSPKVEGVLFFIATILGIIVLAAKFNANY